MPINFQMLTSHKPIKFVSCKDQLVSYIHELSHSGHPELEKRQHPRYSIVCKVILQPVDDLLHPDNECFAAICTNLSEGGIGFIHNEKFTSELYYVELPELFSTERICVLAKLKRCTHVVNGLYSIGCEFCIQDGEYI